MKKAKDWLKQRNVPFRTRHIVHEAPSRDEVRELHHKSGLPLKRFFNSSGGKYKELGLKDKIPLLTDEELYELLASNGMLIKRPIITDGQKVLVGFKEKEWQEVFDAQS